MYEFHCWIGLAESLDGDGVSRLTAEHIVRLAELTSAFKLPTVSARFGPINGEYFLSADGFVNRRRVEAWPGVNRALPLRGQMTPTLGE